MSESQFKFTLQQTVELNKAALCRLCEIAIENLERDWLSDEPPNILDELYLRAHLSELFDRVFSAVDFEPVKCPVSTREEFGVQLQTIVKHYPGTASLFHLPAEQVKEDVTQRLESFKRRLGDQFARQFRDTVNRHEISSPIEQIFLLEWSFQQIEEEQGVVLVPQANVDSARGRFRLDFLVKSKDSDKNRVQIGIELDGHDFHEKTKQQVARDKQRDRAITRSGITVLHFTGSEIVANTTKCVTEIVDFLESESPRKE